MRLFRHFATFRPIKMNNKEKLEQLVLQYAHGNQTLFARLLNVRQSTVSTWKARETLDFVRIKQRFPQVDGNWLLTGEGDMLLPEDNSTSVNVSGNHSNLQGMLVNSQSIDKSESFLTSDAASDVAFLQKENEYLKKLIEEKERLIKVLLAGH